MAQRENHTPSSNGRSLDELLQMALAHHRAGRLRQAKSLCDRILVEDPSHLDALHLNGVLSIQAGHHSEAIALLARVVERAPSMAVAHRNLAAAFHAAGDTANAETSYRRTLALAPDFAEAHSLLGRLLQETDRPGDALEHLREAVRLAPGDADAKNNLGNALQALGDLPAAVRCYLAAIELKPDLAVLYSNLGAALQHQGKIAAAIANYHAAVSLDANLALAHSNLAGLLGDRGDIDVAFAHFERALALDPDNPTTHSNLGSMLYDIGRFQEAIARYETALRLRPGFSRARLNLGIALLKLGDFARGWDAYRARWETGELDHVRRRFATPLWDGGDPKGRTILVYGEQGLGDFLQFCRYVPLLKARGARTVLLTDSTWHPLTALMASLEGADHIAVDATRLPPHDLHCPVVELPRLFGADLSNIPRQIPYVHADRARRALWRNRLTAHDGVRVGLVWAGGSAFKRDHLRSPRLAPLLPLLDVAGVRWFGLQVGDGRDDLEACTVPDNFVDLGPELHDMADTAAVMAELDLVISSCTAPAHLAGALGRPTWITLSTVSDWRWLADREDSPWYPTARLFRQSRSGDWAPVVDRIARELAAVVAGDRTRLQPNAGHAS